MAEQLKIGDFVSYEQTSGDGITRKHHGRVLELQGRSVLVDDPNGAALVVFRTANKVTLAATVKDGIDQGATAHPPATPTPKRQADGERTCKECGASLAGRHLQTKYCETCAAKRDRKSTRLNSSHSDRSRMPSSA